MIDPAETLIAIGYIAGMFSTIIAGAVAVAFHSRGKEPEWVDIPDKHNDGHWICPDCGTDVSFYEVRSNFCSECGTKIDWSEKRGKMCLRRIRFERK